MTEEDRPRKKRVKKVVKKKRVVKKVRRRPEGEPGSAAPASASSSGEPRPRKKVKKKVRRAPAAASVQKSAPPKENLDDLQDEEATPQLDAPVQSRAYVEDEAPARSSSRRSSGGKSSSRKKGGRGKTVSAVEPNEDAILEPMIRNGLILVIIGLFIPLLGTAGSFMAIMGKKRVELSKGTRKGAGMAVPVAIAGVFTCIFSTFLAFGVFAVATKGTDGALDMIGMGPKLSPKEVAARFNTQMENGTTIVEAMKAWAKDNETNGERRFPKHVGQLVQDGTLSVDLFTDILDPRGKAPEVVTADPGKDWYQFGTWVFVYEPVPGEPIFETDRIVAITSRGPGQPQPIVIYGGGGHTEASYQDIFKLIIQENTFRYENGIPLIDPQAMQLFPQMQLNKWKLFVEDNFDTSKLTVRKAPTPTPDVTPDPLPEPQPDTDTEPDTDEAGPDIDTTPQPDVKEDPFGGGGNSDENLPQF